MIASALGYARAFSGQIAEAIPFLEEAVAQAASRRSVIYHSLPVAC
jgi:hypothetical protein